MGCFLFIVSFGRDRYVSLISQACLLERVAGRVTAEVADRVEVAYNTTSKVPVRRANLQIFLYSRSYLSPHYCTKTDPIAH